MLASLIFLFTPQEDYTFDFKGEIELPGQTQAEIFKKASVWAIQKHNHTLKGDYEINYKTHHIICIGWVPVDDIIGRAMIYYTMTLQPEESKLSFTLNNFEYTVSNTAKREMVKDRDKKLKGSVHREALSIIQSLKDHLSSM